MKTIGKRKKEGITRKLNARSYDASALHVCNGLASPRTLLEIVSVILIIT